MTAPAVGFARHPVTRVVLRRLALAVPLLLAVSALSFVLVSFTPGDAAHEILGTNAPEESYQKLRVELGLNQPVYEQYWHWLDNALHGNLGTSLFSGEQVTTLIRQRMPVTLSLITVSLLVILLVGVSFGLLSAVRGGIPARIVDSMAMIGFALPSFWVGAVLIDLFAVRVRWFPATGYVPLTQSVHEWARSLVLPVVALALHGVAAVAKHTREAMLDVLASEHVRMARANGIPERSIIFRHGLKNAGMRTTTVVGIQAVALLGGTVLVENVFALPGLGSLAVSSTLQHDLPVVQGLVVVFTLMVVFINLVVDLVYTLLNPRVRTY
jgi:peptide/nickel transport system permease protein